MNEQQQPESSAISAPSLAWLGWAGSGLSSAILLSTFTYYCNVFIAYSDSLICLKNYQNRMTNAKGARLIH